MTANGVVRGIPTQSGHTEGLKKHRDASGPAFISMVSSPMAAAADLDFVERSMPLAG
jgi:hypothetical protein